jgi:hypothetical protein
MGTRFLATVRMVRVRDDGHYAVRDTRVIAVEF